MASTLVIYSKQHLGKTTQIGQFAIYQYMKTGFPIRLVHADSGGCEHLQDLVKGGFIDLLELRGNIPTLSVMRAVVNGGWKFTGPGAPWLWQQLRDPKGMPIMENGAEKWVRKLVAAGAPPMDLPGGGRYEGNDLSKVGGYAIEGITTLAWAALQELANGFKSSAGDVITLTRMESFDPSKAEEMIMQPSRGDYNTAQLQMLGLVKAATALPVDRVLWTGHEGKGKNEETGQVTRGIGLVGSAATGQLPAALGDMLHIQPLVVKTADGRTLTKRVMYFIEHPDDEEPVFKWPACMRSSVIGGQQSVAAELFGEFPGGWIELDPFWDPSTKEGRERGGLFRYLQLKDAAVARRSQDFSTLRQQIDHARESAGKEGAGGAPALLMVSDADVTAQARAGQQGVAAPQAPALPATAVLPQGTVLTAQIAQIQLVQSAVQSAPATSEATSPAIPAIPAGSIKS